MIQSELGDAHVESLAAVAKAFGVSYTTVKTSWRPGGMPGDSEANRWVLADILIWLLERDVSNLETSGGNEFTKRKQDLQLRDLDAVARIRERKAQVVEGEYMLASTAVRVVRARANLLRDKLMGIDREIRPMLPAKYAQQCIKEVHRYFRNALMAFVEASIHDIEDELKEGTEGNV